MFKSIKMKADETKAFVKKYQVPLAGVAGAAVMFAITRDLNTRVVNEQVKQLTTWNLDNELEHLTLWEFVDHKELRDDYFKFFREMNGMAPKTIK